MELPSGFVRVEAGPAVVVARAALAEALVAAGVGDPEALTQRVPSLHRGRGNLGRLDLGEAGAFVVRPLLRGGLVGKLIRRVSFDRDRAEAELRVSALVATRGASVLDVVAAVTRPLGLGWAHALVSREVAGARDLMTVLAEGEPERRAALEAAGGAVRRAHEAGLDHVDLNLKNLLIAPDGEALVIDLDRCRLAPGPLPAALRERSLLRLLRSWRKLRVAAPEATRLADPYRFARAYAGEDRELRRRLIRAGRGAGFWIHRLRWSLFPPRRP